MSIAAQAIPVVAGLFGALVGSFLNVCIYRLPIEGMTVKEPKRSFCPKCQAAIAWYDNVPVISWLALGAKCRSCRVGINVRYPFVEALTALLFALVAVEMGSGDVILSELISLVFWCVIFASLVVITFVDIDHRIIPDELSVTVPAIVPAFALGLAGIPTDPHLPALLANGRWGVWQWQADITNIAILASLGVVGAGVSAILFRRYSPHPYKEGEQRSWWDTRLAASVGGFGVVCLSGMLLYDGWMQSRAGVQLLGSLLGMGVGAGSIYGVGVLGKMVFRKDAMGFGDVKLMGLMGALLGWQDVLFAFFIACLLGSVVGIATKIITRSSYMPFGPYLCGGTAILVLWPDWVDRGLDWYLGLFQHAPLGK